MKPILLIVFLVVYHQMAIAQSSSYTEGFRVALAFNEPYGGNALPIPSARGSLPPSTGLDKDFMAVPQYFNLGFGTGGFHISYLNTHVKAFFKPLTEPGNSSGIYLGLYNTARLRNSEDFDGDFGIRGTYFLKDLEDKFNIYGKVELALLNLEDDEVSYFLPRIGAGVRWRFLYVEVGTGPNPLHGGLIWQWSTRKTRQRR